MRCRDYLAPSVLKHYSFINPGRRLSVFDVQTLSWATAHRAVGAWCVPLRKLADGKKVFAISNWFCAALPGPGVFMFLTPGGATLAWGFTLVSFQDTVLEEVGGWGDT